MRIFALCSDFFFLYIYIQQTSAPVCPCTWDCLPSREFFHNTAFITGTRHFKDSSFSLVKSHSYTKILCKRGTRYSLLPSLQNLFVLGIARKEIDASVQVSQNPCLLKSMIRKTCKNLLLRATFILSAGRSWDFFSIPNCNVHGYSVFRPRRFVCLTVPGSEKTLSRKRHLLQSNRPVVT